MNSCILMAEIVQNPQLRYTSDNLQLAEMLVQFPGVRAEDPPATLKVVGWGNLAQEIEQNYHQGDRVIIEGRLSMNTFERSEGFKEKRAELTVQRIHAVDKTVNTSARSSTNTAPPAAPTSEKAPKKATPPEPVGASRTSADKSANRVDVIADFATYEPSTPPSEAQDIDDIPF